jgi:aminodeoxyfutalosine synthase
MSNVSLADVEARLGAGAPLTEADATAILETPNLISVGFLAEEARRRRHGDRITYLRVADVGPSESGLFEGALPREAGEIRIVVPPRMDLDGQVALVTRVKAAAGEVPVSGFALDDLERLALAETIPLDDIVTRFRDAGLDLLSVAVLDRLVDASRSLESAAKAGLKVARLTLNRLEAPDRIWVVREAARLQQRSGAILAFAPLPREPLEQPTTGYDDVKQVALARLLGRGLDRIQVDWSVLGAKLAQVAVMFGADDLDGVPPVDVEDLGPRRATIEEVRRNITAASLVPIERNARFEVLNKS